MNDARPIRILLVDDHPVILEGLGALLARAPGVEVAAQAETGIAAVEAYAQHRPDVVLLDLGLPDISGIEVIERIRGSDSRARILVLTLRSGSTDVQRAVQAGCRGYLLKNARREELLAAIETVHRGERHFPAAIARRLAERSSAETLSAREVEVLNLVAAGHRDKEIASALALSTPTVKTHLRNILAKLGVSSRSQAIVAGLESGVIAPLGS